MENPNNKLAYTIHADIGMAPWAWVKDASDHTAKVGGNMADACGWYGDHPISVELEQAFIAWAKFFDNHSWWSDDHPEITFDWQAFNTQGILLAKRLKVELGDSVVVYYSKACEVPNTDESCLEVLLNNDLRIFTPVN